MSFHAFADKQLVNYAFWGLMIDSGLLGVAIAILNSTEGFKVQVAIVLVCLTAAKTLTSAMHYALSLIDGA